VGLGAHAPLPASFWRSVPPLPCVTHPHLGASAAIRQKPFRGPFRPTPCANQSRAVFVNLPYSHHHAVAHCHHCHIAARHRHHHAHHLAPVPPRGHPTAAQTPPRLRSCSRAAALAPAWGYSSTTAVRTQRPFLYDQQLFPRLAPCLAACTFCAATGLSALCVWLCLWRAAEPALASGLFRTRAKLGAMASGAPSFHKMPPPTPPRVRVATPPPPFPSSAAAHRSDSPRCADTAALSGPTGGGARPAAAVIIPEADETAADAAQWRSWRRSRVHA